MCMCIIMASNSTVPYVVSPFMYTFQGSTSRKDCRVDLSRKLVVKLRSVSSLHDDSSLLYVRYAGSFTLSSSSGYWIPGLVFSGIPQGV